MTLSNRFIRPLIVLLTVGLLAALLIPLAIRSTHADPQTLALNPGDQLRITCATRLIGMIEGQATTLECAQPAQGAPTVTGFTGVSEGQTLVGTVTIAAIVSGSEISRVTFALSGPRQAGLVAERAPYVFAGERAEGAWDTTGYPNGDYTLSATAADAAGREGSLMVHFRISNGAAQAPPTPERHTAALGGCGESMDDWHPPVVNGCATGHEHGDPPPDWVAKAGYQASFHGHFNTSALENSAKHAAMKGFAATLNGVEIYLRIHAASNPLDRSARYHSYEIWARDPSGNVSHWQGWYNSGDPEHDRVPRRKGDPAPPRRPIMLVVDQTSYEQGIRCEQWYTAPGEPAWSWDFGWTICNATTLYQPGENAKAGDQGTWLPAPDTSGGTRRRLEASWYQDRDHPTGLFYATQFGEIVAGPDDPRCAGTTTKYGVSYQNVCLDQYIAPTMVTVDFPNNAQEKEFDGSEVKLPN